MAVMLTMLKEQGPFNMSFVIRAEDGALIVIDGGFSEDAAYLMEHVRGQRIAAWFLSHPHSDHITAFMDIMEFHRNEVDVEHVYYNFPPLEVCRREEPGEAHTAERFYRLLPSFAEIAQTVYTGDTFSFAGVEAEVMYHYRPEKPLPPDCKLNSTSLAVQFRTAGHSVLFLGDMDPTSGDVFQEMHRSRLKSDIVQMAHHGHSGVSCDVYMEIDPEVCLWCAPEWLYEEEAVCFGNRLYGTKEQRMWMEKMGVKEHYVSGHGTIELDIT